MAFPIEVEQVALSFGRGYFLGAGTAAAQVSITAVFPGTQAILWEPTRDLFLPFGEQVSAAAGLEGSFLVPRVDQAGWVDQSGAAYTNWYYAVKIRYTHENDSIEITKTVQPTLADMANGIDLEAVFSGDPAPAQTVAKFVRSINGIGPDAAGNVVIAVGSGGDAGAITANDITDASAIGRTFIRATSWDSLRQSLGAYAAPATGIPATTLAAAVRASLGKADTAYQLPETGIPNTALAADVQEAISLAHTGLQPSDVNGLYVKTINGVQPDLSGNVVLATGGGGGAAMDDGQLAALIASDLSATNDAIENIVDVKLGQATPIQYPAQVLNIGDGDGQNHFSLQVAPVGAAAFQTKSQAELQAGYELDPNFLRITENDGIDRVQFWTRMDGATTSGSSYSRTELREMTEDGQTNIGFNMKVGTHWMRGKSRITHLSAIKPEAVIAQLHNGDADRVAIRTQLISGVIKLVFRINGSSTGLPRLSETYVLGTEFEWMIKVINGVVFIYYNDMLNPVYQSTALTPTAGIDTWYFKAGCYGQSNVALGEQPTDFDSIQLRDVQHWHTGWHTPDPVGAYRVVSASGKVTTVAGKTGSVTLTKGDVGLGNVDNTADADKPVSTAQASAISAVAVPTGGTTGQVLAKKSAADRDLQWATPATGSSSSLPAGGTTGQVLTKNSNTTGDAGWATVPTSGGTGGAALPTGGAVGTVLTKTGAADGAYAWSAVPADLVTSVAGHTGAVTLTQADVGLDAVDNTADNAKPLSTSQKTYVDAAVKYRQAILVLEAAQSASNVPADFPAGGLVFQKLS